MTISNTKAKGKRLENKVASRIRSVLGIKAIRMPGSGSMAHFKSDIYSPEFPFSIECKNTEKLRFWQSWEQAERDSGFKKPLLVYSANHRPTMAILKFDDLLDLILEIRDLEGGEN